MPSLQNTRLTELVYIAATTAATIYTNPSSTKSFVRGLILHNTNTTSETVTVHWVPDSSGSVGTASNATRLFKLVVAPDETVMFEIPFSLVMTDTNETIQAATTTASKVTAAVIGDQLV